jgi:hypothetical protein
MSDVTAVIVAARGAGARPGGVAAVAQAPTLAGITAAARAARTPLVWLLRDDAEPQDGALEALLAHSGSPAASLPVGPDGAPVTELLGRYADVGVTEVLAAAQARRVPLRHTAVVSLLAERELVAGLDPPDVRRLGPYAGHEWTARLFARSAGMLVPASRVRVAPPSDRAPAAALRMAGTGVWRRGEMLRELYRALAG